MHPHSSFHISKRLTHAASLHVASSSVTPNARTMSNRGFEATGQPSQAGFALRVRLLGQFAVCGFKDWETGPTRSRGGEILRRLVANPRGRVTLDDLSESLPEGLSYKAAIHRAQMAASGARAYLKSLFNGFDAIDFKHDSYGLDPLVIVCSDVEIFERLYAEGSISAFVRAIELYGGDFLAGEKVEWLQRKRVRLTSMYVDMLERLATDAFDSCRHVDGLRFCELLLSVDRCHESASRLTMRCLAALGLRPHAVAEFATLRRSLDARLGTEPNLETRDVYYGLASGKR